MSPISHSSSLFFGSRFVSLLNRLARLVADAQLEFPALCPGLGLLVLADFEKNSVGSLFELGNTRELIGHHPDVIDFVGDDEFAIDPNLVGIDAADTNLHFTIRSTFKFRE